LTTNRGIGLPVAGARRNWPALVGGVAALAVAVLLLIAAVSAVTAVFGAPVTDGWPAQPPRNWLIVLAAINAGIAGAEFDALRVLNPMDFAVLALVGLAYFGASAVAERTGRAWAAIGAALPFVGIAMLLVTGLTGRSGLMGGGVLVSVAMLRSGRFGSVVGWVGIAANLLLLAGDFGTQPGSASSGVAAALVVGYVLLTAWCAAVGRRLLS
jgi:hypothetical protein